MLKMLMTSDENLVRKSLSGDHKAFREIYEKYKRDWYVICLRYLKNDHICNSVLKNALVNLHAKLKNFKTQKANFKNWSSQIVINECLKHFKQNRIGVTDLRTSTYIDAEDRVHLESISNLSIKELVKLINELPIDSRVVYNMVAIEGYSHEKVGELLEISSSSSKTQFEFAQWRIWKIFENQYSYSNVRTAIG